MAVAQRPRTPPLRRLNAVGLVAVVSLCLAVIVGLVLDVQRRLDALARASSDSVQWSLSQLEIETLLLRESVADPGGDLALVRKRFDIFFSRVTIFGTSTLYAELRERPGFASALGVIHSFIDHTTPLVDGPDPGLRAALPDLSTRTGPLRDAVRAMSVEGLAHFSAESDRQRREMALTLRRVAGMAAFLIIALSVLATVLLRLYQLSRIQALQNRVTTARLETIVGTSVDAIVVVDRAGSVLDFNPAAETVFGFTPAEARGRPFGHLVASPNAATDLVRAIGSAGTEGGGRIGIEAMRKDGTRFPAELSAASAQEADGPIFVVFLRDISERRQAERDLTEARDQALKGERAKAEFLAVMSHEMRTPLNGLLGSVEILGATALAPAQRDILEIIETSGQVLLHHVNSVLDISAAEVGMIRPDTTPFVLEALVREVVANQAGLAAAAGNRIDIVAVTEPAGRVLGDPARLRQILLNLVGNAVKFTRGGVVTVEIEAGPPVAETRRVEIRVIDTGIGIAEADQARVFDDFVTLDSSYGRETGGTGLGLGITRRLVTALGGEIGMESDPGAGSVFWVRLPFGSTAQALPESTPAHLPADAGRPPPRAVLVIEDNAINRFVLRTLLEEAGHSVTEAADGIEGVARADAIAHDLILMDISMPRLDGVEAARRIRGGEGRSRRARIVAVTAHALPQELLRFRTAGIDDCLIKPVTRGTLARVLADRLATPPAPPVVPLPLVDAGELAGLLARLDRAVADDLLRRFMAEGDAVVPRLAAIPPPPQADRLCHRLAGSAATFGARRLAAALVDLAAAPPTGTDPASASAALPELWQATRAALAAARPELLDRAG